MARPLRIGHRALAEVQRDAASWAAAKATTAGGPRASYASLTREGIYRLHKYGGLQDASDYLRQRLETAGLRKPARCLRAESDLAAYATWLRSAGPGVAVHWRVRLNYPLVSGVLLGGEMSRIDVDVAADQYHSILLGPEPGDWPQGLRFPLLQRVVARELDRDERLVRVGIQEIDGSGLRFAGPFSPATIDDAEREARRLARRVRRLLPEGSDA